MKTKQQLEEIRALLREGLATRTVRSPSAYNQAQIEILRVMIHTLCLSLECDCEGARTASVMLEALKHEGEIKINPKDKGVVH